MPEGMAHGAQSEGVGTGYSREIVNCPMCTSGKVHRVVRDGYLQKRVYPLFGYYPWRCRACGSGMMLRKRHRIRVPHESH
jgi:uncharacterized Zn finger protein